MTVEITMGAERDYNESVVLTTDSPASSYGLPVLRVSGRPGRRYDGIDDLGPASQMPGQIVEITCAQYVLAAVEPSCVKFSAATIAMRLLRLRACSARSGPTAHNSTALASERTASATCRLHGPRRVGRTGGTARSLM